MDITEDDETCAGAADEELDLGVSEEKAAWFRTRGDDDVLAASSIWDLDWTLKVAGVLDAILEEGVEVDDGAVVEGCRSSGGLLARLNNLDKVSAGCTTALC